MRAEHDCQCPYCGCGETWRAAITAYLADVPLPAGWTEEDDGEVCRYWEVVEGFPVPVERVIAGKRGTKVLSFPAHWPAIPQAVLIRAAVQCHRLREAGRLNWRTNERA